MGLTLFHLLLLPAVYFIPIWIGGQDALYTLWSRYAHGSLGRAQYELLAGFWAISRCDWSKRTLLFIAGLVVLSLLRVAIMFALTKEHDSLVNELWDLLMNTMAVFVGEALVLAIVLELFRPIWGCLARETTEKPEELTILALLRVTTMAALAGAALRYSGSFSAEPAWFSIHLLLDAALMASCLWLTFATSYAWVGFVGCVASIVSVLLNTPEEIVAKNGPWHWLPSVCLTTFWIVSTLLVVRHLGYRFRLYTRVKPVQSPKTLPTESN